MPARSLEPFRNRDLHRECIAGVSYSPSGTYLASADLEGTIALQNRQQKSRIRKARSPSSPLTGIWFSADEAWLYAGMQGGVLARYSLPDLLLQEQHCLRQNRPSDYTLTYTSKPVLDWVKCTLLPPDTPAIHVALEFRDFYQVEMQGLRILDYRHYPGPLLECAAASQKGDCMLFGDELGCITRYEAATMTLREIAIHHDRVPGLDSHREATVVDNATGISGLAISPDGSYHASASRSGGVQVWRAAAEDPGSRNLWKVPPLAGRPPDTISWIRALAFFPQSRSLAIGRDDGKIIIWDSQSAQDLALMECGSGVRAIAITSDGSEIAAGCEDGGICVVPWNSKTMGIAEGRGGTRGSGLSGILGGFLRR